LLDTSTALSATAITSGTHPVG